LEQFPQFAPRRLLGFGRVRPGANDAGEFGQFRFASRCVLGISAEKELL
jgi:hypothetical protein